MYTRISRSGSRRYLQLVEGFRDGKGKVRQRVIANLGRIDQLEEDAFDPLIHGLQRAVGKVPDNASAPSFEPARGFGDLWALHELWTDLGLAKALRKALRSSRRQFDAEALIRAMVFNRLVEPESKLGVLRWLEEVSLPHFEPDSVTHDQLLRAMDTLMDHREAVEAKVAEQLHPLLDRDLSVVFYDLTTIRISGNATVPEDIRKHGLSKDTGAIARQFALGVVQSADGLPIAMEVYEGNVAETKTLEPMIERLVQRFNLCRVVVVADRAMLSVDNIDALESLGERQGVEVDFILAVPARRYSEFKSDVPQWHTELEASSAKSGEPSVTQSTFQSRRLIIAHDPVRAAEQGRARRDRIEALCQFGDQLAERLDRQDQGKPGRGRRATDRRAYARFQKAVSDAKLTRFVKPDLMAERFCYDVIEPAIEAAERLDGKLFLVTSLSDLQPEQVVERYKALADIERGFRVLKSDIEIAPVYHRLPERIRAHATICFLALVLHRVLRQRLKAAGSVLSPERALRALRQIQRHRVHINGRPFEGLSRPTEQQLELFEKLEVSKPQA
jgi:transposase